MWDRSEVVGRRVNRVHGLEMTGEGQARMFYIVGQEPWHGLGTKLERPATAAEAIVAAKLDYEVVKMPLATSGDELGGLDVPNAFATVRRDTREVLGCVGAQWKPIQNREAFGFMDAVAAENQIEYHTAGSLGKGERIWILAKLPGVIPVGQSDDTVEKYLLLSNSHDGNSSLRVLWTPQRVVCRNTLAVALARGEQNGISIRHSGDLASKVREAQRVLGLAERFYDALPEVIGGLAAHKPSVAQVQSYFKALYPDPENPAESPRAAKFAGETRDMLEDLFGSGAGHDMPGIKGSTWAAYNAVTEYIDHHRNNRSGSTVTSQVGQSRRVESMWFGEGAAIKRSAWALACDMAGVG
jgi:phage/plasmid-like protein (TIGR03299 family)